MNDPVIQLAQLAETLGLVDELRAELDRRRIIPCILPAGRSGAGREEKMKCLGKNYPSPVCLHRSRRETDGESSHIEQMADDDLESLFDTATRTPTTSASSRNYQGR